MRMTTMHLATKLTLKFTPGQTLLQKALLYPIHLLATPLTIWSSLSFQIGNHKVQGLVYRTLWLSMPYANTHYNTRIPQVHLQEESPHHPELELHIESQHQVGN